MTVDWVTVAVAIASALVTALFHSSAQSSAPAAQPASPAPAPTTPQPTTSQPSGKLFHGGLLNLVRGGSASPPASTSAPTAASSAASSTAVAPLATSHPVINSLLSILESEVNSTQGQQLLNQLSGALITLTGANGQQIAVQAGSSTSGGTTNASAASSPVSVGS